MRSRKPSTTSAAAVAVTKTNARPNPAANATGRHSALSLAEEYSSVPPPLQATTPAAATVVADRAAEVIRLHAAPVTAPAAGGTSRLRWLVVVLLAVAVLLVASYFYLTRAIDSAPAALIAAPAQSLSLAAAAAAVSPEKAYVIPEPVLAPRATAPPQSIPAPKRAPELAPVQPTRPIMVVASAAISPLPAAYAALQAGELTRARTLYEEVLRAEPGQVDAHLGLAVIAQSQQDRQSAINHFRAVLMAVPDHPRAWAGVAELAGDGERNALESKLRGLLASNPEDSLHFALGNILMRQSRWAEAQEQFFAATTAAPDNPDYTFNLAVALDRIGKHAAAAVHYRKALQLAAGRPVQFDSGAARDRLAALSPEAP